MSNRLAKEAAKLGGDAVIITRQSAESGSALIPVGSSFVTVPTDDSRLVGKVIVYPRSIQTDPGLAPDLDEHAARH